MPTCGCYHNFRVALDGQGTYRVEMDLEGTVDMVTMFESSGIAERIEWLGPAHALKFRGVFRFFGVSDLGKLVALCKTMKSKIIVDLRPNLDFCFALGPYTLFSADNEHSRSEIGSLLYEAKYRKNEWSVTALGRQLSQAIREHPILNSVTAVSSPPGSIPGASNLVRQWTDSIANELEVAAIPATKTRLTPPQKNLDEGVTEEDAMNQLENSISVSDVTPDSKVLILDDTIRSGGTMCELARALRQAGTTRVYGLSVAKDARFTHGRISLMRGDWE